MKQFVGLDVSQELTHVCVVDAEGALVWQGKCASTPEKIAATIGIHAPQAARIGLETGMLSTWHWHALKKLGLPVVCLDARHAKAALDMQVNKTDKNDAAGLAQIVRTGWYREVQVKSLDSHVVRAMLGARDQLVGMRTAIRNQIRGVLKTFGVVLGKNRGQQFDECVAEIAAGRTVFNQTLRGLLAVLRSIRVQLEKLDRMAVQFAKHNSICQKLMSVPGVGCLTAIAFVTEIDDPSRFPNSKAVGAYLGLTPRRYQSGETDVNGRISKCGDPLVRTYLYEAATSLLSKVQKWSALKAWGVRIAKRSGMKKARVAVARKMAVILHQIWLTGETFRWSTAEANAA